MPSASSPDAGLEAVQKFKPLFNDLGIGFRMAKNRPGRIDEAYVLRIDEESAGVFYINAAQDRSVCFALINTRYGLHQWRYWRRVTNDRTPAINRKRYETMEP